MCTKKEAICPFSAEPRQEFPKYTTQIMNLANQNAQGTRPAVVGQLSELIKKIPEKSYKGWRDWYLENRPDAIQRSTDRIKSMLDNLRYAIELIDEKMIYEWVEDLVIAKTVEGLIIQEVVLRWFAKLTDQPWRLAKPDEESKNIDGFIGDTPVSIKPITYLSKKPTVRESIDIETMYYKKTDKYLTIYLKQS